jgi:hypothetical protein
VGFIDNGLTRAGVEKQLRLYETAARNAYRVSQNPLLLPRMELMQRILELWPGG